MKNSQIFWEGAHTSPDLTFLAAYGASILASSALDLRPPPARNVPVALTPVVSGESFGRRSVLVLA